MNIKKRLATLERSLQTSGRYPMSSIQEVALKRLPDLQQDILKRALEIGFVPIRQSDADELNAAIGGLSEADQHCICQLLEPISFLVLSAADWRL